MVGEIKLKERVETKERSKIKAIFFDVGDTLISIHPSVGTIYSRVCKDFGVDLDPVKLQLAFRKGWRKFGNLVKKGENRYSIFPGGEREWWYRLVCDVLKSCGTDNIDTRLPDAIHDAFKEEDAWKVYPEVKNVLKRLKDKRLTLAIISNWDSRLYSLLDVLGLKYYFDFILVSSKENIEKPSEDIFRRALNLAQVLPYETFHIGDRLEEDYRGAKTVGIKALLIDRKNRHNGDVDTIRSLEDVFKYIN